MSIESLYADRIEEAIQRQLRNPGPAPQPPSFSTWSMLASGVKGLPSAALETAGSISDLMAAEGRGRERMLADERAAHPDSLQTFEAEKARRAEAQKQLDAAGPSLRRRAEEFAPDPQTAHTADQVVHGLVRGVGKAVGEVAALGPVAGPVAFGLDEGNTAAQRLREQGVDTATASKVGLVTGVVQTAGAAIPGVGPTVLKTLGLAALTGPASYVTQEAASREILKRADYGDLAAQHDPTDPLGLALSIGIPGAVAGLHIRGLMKRTALADVVKHIESGGQRYGADGQLLTSPKGAQGEMQVMPGTATDPGFGVTPARDNSADELARVGRDYLAAMQQRYGDPDKALAAYNAGPGALDAALKAHGDNWLAHMPDETQKYVAKADKLMGKHIADEGAKDPAVVDAARVKVLDGTVAKSLPDRPTALAEVMAASDELAAGRMSRVEPISEPAMIERRFAEKLTDHEAAVEEYAARPDSEGGKVLNTDIARELSPDYLKDRTQSAAVHEPASAFVKRLYAEKLAQMEPGERVVFTSGGTGSGKTTAIGQVPQARALVDDAAIVYDTNMNTLHSAAAKIDQALAAGAQVHILHVQRDAVEALVHGALPRAMRQEREFGTGRTVPLSEHAKTHRGSAQVVQQLADKYKDNPNVDIQVIDNTRGKGGAVGSDLGFVRGFDYNGLEGKLHEALRQEHDAGRISESVFRGTSETDGSGSGPVLRANGGERAQHGDGESSAGTSALDPEATQLGAKPTEPGTNGARADGSQPADQQRLKTLLEEQPNLKVKLPGSDETVSVEEALLRAHEAYDDEMHVADLVKLAAQCALANGG